MKIPPLSSQQQRMANRHGFTLIELLVVISIIAVLAGLLFPAMGAVRTSARKASAKNDCMQIVNAIKNFYTDYGKYPSTTQNHGILGAANGGVIGELRASITATTRINKRNIRYIEVPEKKPGGDGLVRSGIEKPATGAASATADWKDPWGLNYAIFIDHNYDHQLASVPAPFGGTTVNTGVAAASYGPPEKTQATPSVANYKGPVKSWE